MKREPRFPDGCKSCWVLPSRGRSNRLPPKPPAVKTIHDMLIAAKLEHNPLIGTGGDVLEPSPTPTKTQAENNCPTAQPELEQGLEGFLDFSPVSRELNAPIS